MISEPHLISNTPYSCLPLTVNSHVNYQFILPPQGFKPSLGTENITPAHRLCPVTQYAVYKCTLNVTLIMDLQCVPCTEKHYLLILQKTSATKSLQIKVFKKCCWKKIIFSNANAQVSVSLGNINRVFVNCLDLSHKQTFFSLNKCSYVLPNLRICVDVLRNCS